MALNKPSNAKKPTSSNNSIVLFLLGFTIVYQIIYQAVMHSALTENEGPEHACDGENADKSPQCVELQLFRNWQEADTNETYAELERLSLGNSLDARPHVLNQDHPWMGELSTVSNESTPSTGIVIGTVLKPIQEKASDGLAGVPEVGLESKWSPITKWGHSLEALQGTFEARMEKLPSVRRQRSLQRKLEFDRLYNDTLAAIHNRSSITPWGKDLMALQAHFEAQWESLPSVRHQRALKRKQDFDKLYNDTLAAIHNRSSITPWARDLMALQDRLQARMDNLTAAHQRVIDKAHLPSTTPAAEVQDLLFLDQIYSFGHELCAEPERRGYVSCRRFLVKSTLPTSASLAPRASLENKVVANASTYATKLSRAQAENDQWEDSFTKRVAMYMEDLCADPLRRDYPSCASFQVNVSTHHVESRGGKTDIDTTVANVLKPALRGSQNYASRLQWSSVVSWSGARKKEGLISVGDNDLRFAKWQGKIPKVACITVISSEDAPNARLKYFINNFKLQTYEGPRQLVLVYNHADEGVSKLVRTYADGTYIKAIATRGDIGPSTTAFRYGAWSADADIIARWNFDEWHHPDRLSMQVRALAIVVRPVSILKQWMVRDVGSTTETIADNAEKMTGEPGWEGSLVGEAVWMRKHWMPLMAVERDVLKGVQARWVVQVDMPMLVVYNTSDALGGNKHDVKMAK